ncbi:MAG: hypothetical protein E6K81_04375 [Candidatus Eisenbacteria bacterium]|uniref:YCII-related domain-containing protein n=1 Tax=Eiseniibacteriota bacterium TaxID=2212470 RepID=A0A538UCG0_UNCEI|nr:MAG: hypothetical protein E6K81_04375 [Candidatus Eisenbacteria bacterium]
MEFMFLFMVPAGSIADPGRFAEMGKFAAELASQGILRRGAPLGRDSDAQSVRVRDGRAFVSDGPFAESKEVVGGFWIVDVAGREEALAIAKRCPHARYAPLEVHAVGSRFTYADPGRGTPYLLAFRMEPGLSDPDGAKYREMIAFSERLGGEGALFETAPLVPDPPPAWIEPLGGKVLVTDGPFAESKEGVGGYGLVRVADRAQAIELAKRYPHARWGPIEVREILFFDPV